MNITLSTKEGYPSTFICSESLTIEGYDSFISIDFSRRMDPQITLIGFTISGHPTQPNPKLMIGDKVTIGTVEYEIQGPKKYLSNSNIKLVPAE